MLDASITLAWCFEDQSTPLSNAALDRLVDDQALVPELWPFEVANVLAHAVRRGRITHDQACRFVQLLDRLPIRVEELGREHVLGAVLTLAETTGLSTYDASYLSLAATTGVQLASADDRLNRAAHLAGVELFLP